MKTSTGTTSLYPKQMFGYKGLVDSLKDLVYQPDRYEMCELWRTRITVDSVLIGIYSGKV